MEVCTLTAKSINSKRCEHSSCKEDKLPEKFLEQLVGFGPSAGVALTHEGIETALDEYYCLAGFTNSGIPTPTTHKQLDIEWAAEYLLARAIRRGGATSPLFISSD